MASGPGNWNWQSNLRDVASGGHNTGDIVNGWRWSGESWTPERGTLSGGGGGGSWEDTVKRSIEMMKEANKPAIASFQAQIPELTASYAGQRTVIAGKESTLQERYKNLIAQIGTKKTADVNAQTVVTSNEMGKRGLLPSSTYVQQELINRNTPITDKYNNLEASTNLDQTQGLQELAALGNQLTTSEVADKRAIAQAIAQLEAGGAAQGIQYGSQQYNADQQRILAQQEAEYKANQDAIANAIAQGQLANQTAKTQYDINAPYFKPETGGGIGIGGGLGYYAPGNTTTTNNKLVPGSQYNPSWAKPPAGYGYNSIGQLLPL